MNEIGVYRQQLADHDARERARNHPRPAWRIALDNLFIANYANDEFWFGSSKSHGLQQILFGEVSDLDLQHVRLFYAAACQICQCPLHATWQVCQKCGARREPEHIISSTLQQEISS